MTKTEMAMNMGSGAVDRYKNGVQSFTLLKADLCQDINYKWWFCI